MTTWPTMVGVMTSIGAAPTPDYSRTIRARGGRVTQGAAPRIRLRHPLPRAQLFELRTGVRGPTPPAPWASPLSHPSDVVMRVHEQFGVGAGAEWRDSSSGP